MNQILKIFEKIDYNIRPEYDNNRKTHESNNKIVKKKNYNNDQKMSDTHARAG